jgi:hypothetical protein
VGLHHEVLELAVDSVLHGLPAHPIVHAAPASTRPHIIQLHRGESMVV